MFRRLNSQPWLTLLFATCAVLATCATSKADLIIDITPAAVVQGVDLSGEFEIDLTNTGPAVHIEGFQFTITVSGASNLTFTDVDIATLAPYIFDGNGLGTIVGAGAGTNTISASDLDTTFSFDLGTGQTVGLGHVTFDASSANLGAFPVTIVGGGDTFIVTDFGNQTNLDFSTGTEGPITVIRRGTGGEVPEPSSLVSLAGLLGCSLFLRRRRK